MYTCMYCSVRMLRWYELLASVHSISGCGLGGETTCYDNFYVIAMVIN